MTPRLVLAVVTLGAVPLEGQVTDLDRFQLFTACAPVAVVVDVQDDGGVLAELTESSVRPVVSSRLRSTRIYAEDMVVPLLSVEVLVVASAFHIESRLLKSVYDPVSGQTNGAFLWRWSVTGLHGGKPDNVRARVADLMDIFLDEYLRVNTEACDSTRP